MSIFLVAGLFLDLTVLLLRRLLVVEADGFEEEELFAPSLQVSQHLGTNQSANIFVIHWVVAFVYPDYLFLGLLQEDGASALPLACVQVVQAPPFSDLNRGALLFTIHNSLIQIILLAVVDVPA